MGYWTYNGEGHYKTLEEMWEHIKDYENYSDEVDLERWIDSNYCASQIVWKLNHSKYSEEVVLDLIDEYEEEVWSPNHMDDLIEGKDYDYNGFEFTWVDEDDEENEED